MAITKYEGQPLLPGTIICRESMMRDGICGQPVAVVSESASTVVIRDLRDGNERRRKKADTLFICDTEAEGWAMHSASMALVDAEMKIAREQAKERALRKQLAIDVAINGANA